MSENKLEPQTSPVTSIDVKKLPSKGLSYPEGTTISFRTYGYGEIKKLASSNLSEKEAFALVLSGINTNINKNDITFGDFMYLAIFRKISTLGTTKLKVPYKTPVHGEVRQHVFSVEDLEIDDLNVESLPINLKTSDDKDLEFYPLTIGDAIKAIDSGKMKDPTYLMSLQCKNLKIDDAYAYIGMVTNADDLTDLGTIESLLAHNLKPLKFDCKEVVDGREVTNSVYIRLEGRQALLMPFREQGVPSRSGISFGKGA